MAEPDGLLERFGRGPYCRVDHLSEWIDIRFVARLTEDVGYFIYFPFLILLILIVSRLSFFDGWGITGGLWLIFLASGICAISNTVVLERTARKVRRKTLTDLLMDLAIAREQENGSDSTVKQIEWLITEVRGFRHGAFAPVFHQPVARTMIAIAVSSALLLSEQFL